MTLTDSDLAQLAQVSDDEVFRAAHKRMVEMAERGTLTILDLFDHLPWFKTGSDWTAWRAFLCAVYGLPMTPQELRIYQKCTGRTKPPTEKADEVWGVCGRRARKSAVMSLIGVWEGAFRDHSKHVAPGEPPRVMVTSKDKDDAQTIHSFVAGILAARSLAHLKTDDITERITLSNKVEIVTRAAKLSAGRSKTIVCALLDEIAFWPTDESAAPDKEILRGIRPAMANVRNPLLVAMSSPYARRGELYTNYRKHFGQDGDPILVWVAPTLAMHDNETIREFVTKEWEKDPVSAASEVGSPEAGIVFRPDVKAFVTEEIVDRVTAEGVTVRRAQPNVQYFAFCDPSGGSSDSMTLSIAHVEWREHGTPIVVQDCLREWQAPFEPDEVVREIVPILRGKPEQGGFGLTWVKGDRYGGDWPAAMFAKYGIAYVEAEKTKGQYYKALLPLMNSGLCELLDNRTLRSQLTALDRSTTPSGQETITHPPNGHDDVANATAGVVVEASINLQLAPPKKEQTFVREDGTIDYAALDKQRRKEQMEALLNPPTQTGSGRYDMA